MARTLPIGLLKHAPLVGAILWQIYFEDGDGGECWETVSSRVETGPQIHDGADPCLQSCSQCIVDIAFSTWNCGPHTRGSFLGAPNQQLADWSELGQLHEPLHA